MPYINDFSNIREKINKKSPLVHCITNPISINDCANFVLALGAKPIMAEHPLEVEEITAAADVLAVNMGNITDARLKSIELSAKKADELSIPWIIDIVGVNCSKLRYEYVKNILNITKPAVIKGNMSEIKAISSIENHSKGIDAMTDSTSLENIAENVNIVKALADKYNTVVVASGKIDIVSDGKTAAAVENGCEMLSLITGTGCILNVLTAVMLTEETPLNAGITASALLGIAGQQAKKDAGTGTFKTSLLDRVSLMTQKDISDNIKVMYY